MGDRPMSDTQPLPIEATAIVRPGDTLILRLAERARPQDVEEVRAAVREALPDVEVLIIGGVEDMAVYRPGDGR
jgi:hypothetical protein